jgi:hypothetical protein
MVPKTAAVAIVALWLAYPGAADADVIVDWNGIMVRTVATQNPFAQARFAAIAQLAVFEAVNACTGDYEPYLGTIPARFGASAEAAAIAAAHGVLRNYFPGSAAELDAARATSLAQVLDGQAKADGIAVGESAAAAMIAVRADDGSAPPETYLATSNVPGSWQPTPPAFGAGILLHWRNLAPFGIQAADQFRSAPPPEPTSNKYRKSYDEVKEVGAIDSPHRPQDRADVARYFAVVSAVDAWNSAVAQVSVAQGRSVPENARAFALLNMAISDGLVSSMETKYYFTLWRPVTAIRAGSTNDNPLTDEDALWTPLIVTPPFPSYPSAHASASYAARRVAERILGSGGHAITLSHPGVPNVVLHYTTFHDLTSDIDDARVYGGIHFRFDQQAGARQGRRVGSYIYRNHLNSLRDCRAQRCR